MRHNKIRDTFANTMHDVCYDVGVEPTLQPTKESESFIKKTAGTDENARLDTLKRMAYGGPGSAVISST